MNRPTRKDIDFKAVATKLFDDEVSGWIVVADGERDGYIDDLSNSIKCVRGLDGYDLASHLEMYHNFTPSAGIVSALDQASWMVRDAITELVKEWVADNEIKPTYSVGDTVTYKSQSGTYSGEIITVNEDVAEYTVRVTEYGHGETSGFILAFEVLEGYNG